MSIRTKRVVHSFVRAFIAIEGVFLLEHYADLTNAVRVGDWLALKTLGLAALGAALAGAIRALQGYVPSVPSPEPSENQ